MMIGPAPMMRMEEMSVRLGMKGYEPQCAWRSYTMADAIAKRKREGGSEDLVENRLSHNRARGIPDAQKQYWETLCWAPLRFSGIQEAHPRFGSRHSRWFADSLGA